jgi:tetratricopeptide (TPR) repeat protein
MRWLKTEYILKGLFLGLLLFVALQEAQLKEFGFAATARVTLLALGGVVLALGVAALLKLREGYRTRGNFVAFLIFLLLESSTLVYAGSLLGLGAGAYILRPDEGAPLEEYVRLLVYTAAGGALLGVLFGSLQTVQQRGTRLVLSLLMAILLGGAALAWLGPLAEPLKNAGFHFDMKSPLEGANPDVFAVQILLGLPIFYLLTFAGHEEETEVEIAAACAGLALSFGILMRDVSPNFRALSFFVPLLLFFVYTWKILPGLRVFKHALRGLSYSRVGRHRKALIAFRRALALDPNNQLAKDGFWGVHCALDLNALANDPQTLQLVDFELCLSRAGSLLLAPNPAPDKVQEAMRLLDLVLSQRPNLRAAVAYWRAVAATHAHDLDTAVAEMEVILDPGHLGAGDPQRQAVLFRTWQLALLLHDELRRRVGFPQLERPGRRMEAISAVERRLASNPEDADAWSLKRILYDSVTEAEYEQARPGLGLAVEQFDHGYAQQLGLALINDEARWQRGGEYLRLAAHGLPLLGPTLFIHIAQAHQRNGNGEGAWHNYELAKRAGQSVGPKNLSDEDRHAYFAVLKMLGDAGMSHDRTDLAIENYQLYSEYERAGVETLRTLADLYEKKSEVMAALVTTEKALVYAPSNADLLARKDRYYYSVMPEQLRGKPDAVPGGFDFNYCIDKARTLLSARELDLDTLDWAQHLADLATAVKPESVTAKVLLARAKLRRGDRDAALLLLEDVHNNKPAKFVGEDDEDLWYQGARLLGDLYLNEIGRPDLAVICYKAFRESAKSGADTLFKLGQAYEQMGDHARAAKCYEQVTAYEGHPLAYEARSALARMQPVGR